MINIAIDVRRAVELVSATLMLGFNNDIVEVPIADPDPTNISVIINKIFCFFKLFHFFFNTLFSFLSDFNMFS